MRRAPSVLALAALAALAASCGGAPRAASPGRALASPGVGAFVDPTVRGARFVPVRLDERASLGVDPGGATRTLVAGLRMRVAASGAVEVAADRLPQIPRAMLELPERLGGGFLFALDTTVWRADAWLAPARPLLRFPAAVTQLHAGLDRVYASAQNEHFAFDGRSGATLPLGPWPGTTSTPAYASLDGWHALAVTDLRGFAFTSDAGASWRTIRVPVDAPRLGVVDGVFRVTGIAPGPGRAEVAYSVLPDGEVVPAAARAADERAAGDAPSPREPSPLALAVESGWPLTDGTALVARDGRLTRVRLSDGAVVDAVDGAFPERPSRCQGVSLSRPGALGAFGFVCGAPQGKTTLYAYAPYGGRLVPLRTFDEPRVVVSSGNGAIVVRGACAPVDEGPAKESRFCVLGHDGVFRDLVVRGGSGADRVVALADGRVVVLSPGEPGVARLTMLERGHATTRPIVFARSLAWPKAARLPDDVERARALRLGVWLDGFEERRPGVVGGWLEVGGAMLGLEIEADGAARVGAWVRDAGAPFVAGRYGFGFTAARRGYETTDGGMTWTAVDVPDPLVPPAQVEGRACGPVGCLAGGWARVGWGETAPPAPPVDVPPVARLRVGAGAPPAPLRCEAVAPEPRVAPPSARPPAAPTVDHLGGLTTRFGAHALPAGGLPLRSFAPFYALAEPPLAPTERGQAYDVFTGPERFPRTSVLARVHVWGVPPDVETTGRAQVRWISPFGAQDDVHASAATPAPPPVLEATRAPASVAASWSITVADDERYALLALRPAYARPDVSLVVLEDGHPPTAVRFATPTPPGEIEGAVRLGGRWYVSTPSASGVSPQTTTVWVLEGDQARELAQVPRAAAAGRAPPARLARHAELGKIAVVTDGPGGAGRGERWLLPLDVDSGDAGEPRSLGPTDLSSAPLAPCAVGRRGPWLLDAPLSGTLKARVGAREGTLRSVVARLRYDDEGACLERIAGTFDAGEGLVGAPRAVRRGELAVTASVGGRRYGLACTR